MRRKKDGRRLHKTTRPIGEPVSINGTTIVARPYNGQVRWLIWADPAKMINVARRGKKK